MQLAARKLVTIICEAELEARLAEDVLRLGARGYTVTEARGRGTRGVRDAAWGPSSNVRFEVVCDEPVMAAILEHVRSHYSDDYALVLFASDVQVLRPEKF